MGQFLASEMIGWVNFPGLSEFVIRYDYIHQDPAIPDSALEIRELCSLALTFSNLNFSCEIRYYCENIASESMSSKCLHWNNILTLSPEYTDLFQITDVLYTCSAISGVSIHLIICFVYVFCNCFADITGNSAP